MVDYEKLLRKEPPKKKSYFWKYVTIGIGSILGLLLLFLIGWAIYFNSQFILYKDDLNNFSIKYPKSWKVIIHPKKTVMVAFLRPKDSALDTLRENFDITVQPLPKGVFTLEEFSGMLKAQMISVYGRHIIEFKPIRLGWRQGYKISVLAPKPDNLIMINAWVLAHDQAYILTFLGNINKYPDDYLVLRQMIRSFRVK